LRELAKKGTDPNIFRPQYLYEFQPDNVGGWHGYPIPGNEAPPSVLRKMLDSGQITKANYGKLLKGKK